MQDSEIAIQVDNISKSYRLYQKQSDRLKEALNPLRKAYSKEFFALKNVSFSIRKGETIGIVGRNGSGKSTLLQILCGILQPSQGSVKTNGKISSLLELGTGFNPEYSGIENIYLNASIMGLSKAEIEKNLEKIIAFADIGDFIYQPVKTYSSGMYVRLAFAIQANIDPDILIVDEALAVGDAQFVHRCMLRFHQLQKEGKTIILVTHDASSVKTLCSRALWIDKGELRACGNSSTVVDQYLNEIFEHEEKEDAIISDTISTGDYNLPPLSYDQRLGDGKIEILACGLLNQFGSPSRSINQDEEAQIFIKIQCKTNAEITPLLGLILKDPKGLEIASTISRMEKFNYPSLKPGQTLDTILNIKIPRLYPGPYSLTPTVSYLEDAQDKIADRLVNGIIFEIVANRECHTLLSLETRYSVQ